MDSKAKSILLKAYWGSAGWKNGSLPDEDFAYARQHGLMFDPLSLPHDSLVRRAIKARDAVEIADVGTAFICSLSTRQPYLRSALGSYGNCEDLKRHRFRPYAQPPTSYLCGKCNAHRANADTNLNVLNFERIKWGGVRHEQVLYNMFDLEQFALLELPEPWEDDVQILREILKTIESSGSKDSTGKLRQRLRQVVPSNNDEAQVLLDILGYARVLSGECRGDHGYDANRTQQLFGEWL